MILLFSCAEKVDPIVNVWTVSEMSFGGVVEENLDPQCKMMLDQMKASVIGGIYTFKADGTYDFTFKERKDNGTYRFSEDRKTLYVKNAKEERDYSLVSFTADKMEWTRQDKKAFLTLTAPAK